MTFILPSRLQNDIMNLEQEEKNTFQMQLPIVDCRLYIFPTKLLISVVFVMNFLVNILVCSDSLFLNANLLLCTHFPLKLAFFNKMKIKS